MKSLIILSVLSSLIMASNDFYIEDEGVKVRVNNNQVTIRAVQRYKGNSSTTFSPYVGIFLSNDTVCSSVDDEFLGESDDATLSLNDLSDRVDIPIQLPNKAKKGVWYICAIADSKNEYSETDESNNASYREIEDGQEYGFEHDQPDVRFFLFYDEKRDFFSIRYFTRNVTRRDGKSGINQIGMYYSYDKSSWKRLDINSNEGTFTSKIKDSLKHNKIYVKVSFGGYDTNYSPPRYFSSFYHDRELSYTPNTSVSNEIEGSIYDGTGSLISPKYQGWGSDRDEAKMHPHFNKNSTVTFQYLYDSVNCDHIDIHSSIDLKQDVYINVKEWSADTVENSYKVKLPVANAQIKDGISIKSNHKWTTLAVTTTKPIKEKVSIYAFCRSAVDSLNTIGVEKIEAQMTELDKGHKHLGNGSLISTAKENGQDGIGRTMDIAITSNSDDAETSFQIKSSKGICEEITLADYDNNSDIEEVLIKEWSEEKWHQTRCTTLPCKLKVYFSKEGNSAYTLINAKTKAGQNGQLYTVCGKKEIKFNLNEKISQYKHPNECKFKDVSVTNPNYQYVTALCSAQIIHGYESTNYTEYRPENSALWSELTKVVQLSENFYKVRKLKESYNSENWFNIYIDLAKKRGFYKEPLDKIKRGYAFKYIVSVFWKKDNISEDDASIFLKEKGVISELDTDKYLKRGDMAKIVLYASRLSADESNIERKLAYIDYKDENINDTKIIPKDIFETPKATDNDSKKEETINKNIEIAKRENSVVSENGTTNNTGLTMAILGGKGALKAEYKDKSTATEIINETKKQGVNKPVNNNNKIKPNSTVEVDDENTGQTFIAHTTPTEDEKGNAMIIVENEPGEKVEVTKSELEKNGKTIKSQFSDKDILDKK